MKNKFISESLSHIFKGIDGLKAAFPDSKRQFTIDGRLVGDIGEVLAAVAYDIILDEVSQPKHDGTTSDNRRVQIKATFQDHLTFSSIPDYYLGIAIDKDGRWEEIYNGPGRYIAERYAGRKGIGSNFLRFPNKDLREISTKIPTNERINKRNI